MYDKDRKRLRKSKPVPLAVPRRSCATHKSLALEGPPDASGRQAWKRLRKACVVVSAREGKTRVPERERPSAVVTKRRSSASAQPGLGAGPAVAAAAGRRRDASSPASLPACRSEASHQRTPAICKPARHPARRVSRRFCGAPRRSPLACVQAAVWEWRKGEPLCLSCTAGSASPIMRGASQRRYISLVLVSNSRSPWLPRRRSCPAAPVWRTSCARCACSAGRYWLPTPRL